MAVQFEVPPAKNAGAFPLMFSFLIAALVMSFSVFASNPASASNPRYSALVMNADTGDVLYSRSADSRRYPASLTKVMTLYMLFEALDAGTLTMESELAVSRRAAGQPPSKLGVVAGTTISVSDAIQALAVRSANDVAVVVAEALSGSEWQFGRDMTARAVVMGMNHTRFENASGLPHSRQQTTARDLGMMAMHMVRDFPQHLHYFSQMSFTYGDRTWQTHNHLLENYPGTTGMKTGYIRASGFNLIATVERDGVSLVGIVLGGRSVVRRDNEMIRLLDLNFARMNEDPYFGSRIFSAEVSPLFRPDPASIESAPVEETQMAAIRLTEAPALRPSNIISATLATIPSPELAPALAPAPAALVAEAETLIEPQNNPFTDLANATMPEDSVSTELAMVETDFRPSFALGLETGLLDVGSEPDEEMALLSDEVPAATGQVAPYRDIQGSGGPQSWGIRLGQFDMPEQADAQLRAAAVTAPTILTWGMAAVFPDRHDDGYQFAAGFGPMTEDEAMDACSSLARSDIDCQTMDQVDWNTAVRR